MVFPCFNQSLTGTRFASPVIVKGKISGLGSETPLSFKGSVHPVRGHELKSLPEGRRENVTKKILTTFALQGIDENAKTNPDRVDLEDGKYEVVHVTDWGNNIINHNEVFLSRVNQ